jgi:hypothetical protein
MEGNENTKNKILLLGKVQKTSPAGVMFFYGPF